MKSHRTCAIVLAAFAAGCAHTNEASHGAGKDPWRGLTRESIQLGQKLLVVKGAKGIVVCPYLDIEALEATGEAAAVVSAPDFDGLPTAHVIAVTSKGQALGLRVGMPGRDAFDLIR